MTLLPTHLSQACNTSLSLAPKPAHPACICPVPHQPPDRLTQRLQCSALILILILSSFHLFRLRLPSKAAVDCDAVVRDECSFQEVRINRTSLTFGEMGSFALGNSRHFQKINRIRRRRAVLLVILSYYSKSKVQTQFNRCDRNSSQVGPLLSLWTTSGQTSPFGRLTSRFDVMKQKLSWVHLSPSVSLLIAFLIPPFHCCPAPNRGPSHHARATARVAVQVVGWWGGGVGGGGGYGFASFSC